MELWLLFSQPVPGSMDGSPRSACPRLADRGFGKAYVSQDRPQPPLPKVQPPRQKNSRGAQKETAYPRGADLPH